MPSNNSQRLSTSTQHSSTSSQRSSISSQRVHNPVNGQILANASYNRAINNQRRAPSSWAQITRNNALNYRGTSKTGAPGFYSHDPNDRTNGGPSSTHDSPWGRFTMRRGRDVVVTTNRQDYNNVSVPNDYNSIMRDLIGGRDRAAVLRDFVHGAEQPYGIRPNSKYLVTDRQRNAAAKLFGILNGAEELRTPGSGKEGMAHLRKMINNSDYHPFSAGNQENPPFLAAKTGGKRLQQGFVTNNQIGDCPPHLFNKSTGITSYFSAPSVRSSIALSNPSPNVPLGRQSRSNSIISVLGQDDTISTHREYSSSSLNARPRSYSMFAGNQSHKDNLIGKPNLKRSNVPNLSGNHSSSSRSRSLSSNISRSRSSNSSSRSRKPQI